MRLVICAFIIAATTGAYAQSASSRCLTIDSLDTIHAVLARLSRNPNSALFRSDLRILHTELSIISERKTLEAIDSNVFSTKGSNFVQLLRNTQALLQKASLDDPNSVINHFNADVRSNLADVEQYLVELRCTDEETAMTRQQRLQMIGGRFDIIEDDDATEILREAAREFVNFKNLLILLGLGIGTAAGVRVARQLLRRQRRRARRHPVTYATEFRLEGRTAPGTLIDINCFGTKLKHTESSPIAQGLPVEVEVCDIWTAGTVVWTNAHYAGVQFKQPIGLRTVQQVREAPIKPGRTQNGAQMDAA